MLLNDEEIFKRGMNYLLNSEEEIDVSERQRAWAQGQMRIKYPKKSLFKIDHMINKGIQTIQESLTLDQVLDLEAHITWLWDKHFLLGTAMGNWLYSSPEYDGDNGIWPTPLLYKSICKQYGISYGRDKGRRIIRDFVNAGVKLESNKGGFNRE